jgi:predicted Zn-dependent protease
MKNRIAYALPLLALLTVGCAQAGFDLKSLLKEVQKAQQPAETPASAAPAAPAAAAPVAAVPSAAAAPAEKPGDQFLKSLIKGKTSPEEEHQIGQQIAGNLLGAAPLVKDEALQRYVNRVGRWVSLQSERPDLVWRFGVIETEDLNAFAAPGGFIFITKGLYKQLHNEAELAGVLGHEIGHVVRKHHLKLLQKSQGIAAVGALFSKQVKSGPAFVQNLIGNGAEIVARGLDKDAEFEADRLGLVYAARAGYDAYALPAVLDAIGHSAKGDPRTSLLFKTHPHPADRLNRLSEAAADRLDALPEGRDNAGRFYKLR